MGRIKGFLKARSIACGLTLGLLPGTTARAAEVTFSVWSTVQAEQVISGDLTPDDDIYSTAVVRWAKYGEFRSVMEFPLPSVIEGFSITSARLETYVSSFASHPAKGLYPDLSFHGYRGDGVYSAADGLIPFNPIGRSNAITALRARSDGLDSAYVQALYTTGASHLGVMAYAETPEMPVSLARGVGDTDARPALRVTATVPDRGTLVARPLYDAVASLASFGSLTLTEGEDTIRTQNASRIGIDRRGMLEYHLGSIPRGATIESAKLTFDVTPDSSNATGAVPQIELSGYYGDGIASAYDILGFTRRISTGSTLTGPGTLEVTLDPAALRSLLEPSTFFGGGDGYVGIIVRAPDGQTFDFANLESGKPATLTITYAAVPEPGSLALFAVCVGATLLRRPRCLVRA